jgi:hypothetical protein
MPLVSKNFSDIITFTRASTATHFDSAGVLQSAANNTPRFDYNPATLAAQGLLIEESRTNSIRNNTMQGAVAGTPGTAPTNWLFSVATTTGLTTEVVGTGAESGITYVDLKVSGTAVGAGSLTIAFEPNTQTVASQNQVWTVSMYRRLMAGSFNGLTPTITNIFLNSYTAVGAFDAASTSQVRSEATPTSAALNTQRSTLTGTLSSATTARVNVGMFFSIANGAAIDITLRIGLPQLEQGAFATSVIPTTTTALTRAADVASVNTLSPWFNAAASTVYIEALTTPGLAAFPAQLSISDGTSNNRLSTYSHTSGYFSNIRSGGSVQGDPGLITTPTVGAQYKFAVGVETNNAIACLNGTLGLADTSIVMPVGANQMRIGANETGGAYSNTWIRRITYYPRRLSNAELQAITA